MGWPTAAMEGWPQRRRLRRRWLRRRRRRVAQATMDAIDRRCQESFVESGQASRWPPGVPLPLFMKGYVAREPSSGTNSESQAFAWPGGSEPFPKLVAMCAARAPTGRPSRMRCEVVPASAPRSPHRPVHVRLRMTMDGTWVDTGMVPQEEAPQDCPIAEPVTVFCPSRKRWFDDAMIIKRLAEPGFHDCTQLKAGSVKVRYNKMKTCTWLLPAHFKEYLKDIVPVARDPRWGACADALGEAEACLPGGHLDSAACAGPLLPAVPVVRRRGRWASAAALPLGGVDQRQLRRGPGYGAADGTAPLAAQGEARSLLLPRVEGIFGTLRFGSLRMLGTGVRVKVYIQGSTWFSISAWKLISPPGPWPLFLRYYHGEQRRRPGGVRRHRPGRGRGKHRVLMRHPRAWSLQPWPGRARGRAKPRGQVRWH